MISGDTLKGIKNFKPISIIGFIIAYFALKTYFTQNYKEKDFTEISGIIKTSQLVIKPKYKYFELTFKNDYDKTYEISGPKLNFIENYEDLSNQISRSNKITIKVLKNKKNLDDKVQVFYLKSDEKVLLNLKESIAYTNSNRQTALWVGIAFILISLFLLTGINIIIDKNGITITKI